MLRDATTGTATATATATETAAAADGIDRAALVQGFLPIVHHLVNDMARRVPRRVLRDDLLSAALWGLAQAARSFDPARGVPFDRFARTRIQGALLDELRSKDWASRSVRANARRMDEVGDQLAGNLGRAASAEEIAGAMGVPAAEVHRLRDDLQRASVLQFDSVFAEGDEMNAPVDHAADPGEILLARETRAYVRDALAQLPERLRFVVVRSLVEERPMHEIAAELGVTESRVSQLRSRGLELMGEAISLHLESGQAPKPEDGVAARRRAAYCASVAAASDYRSRISATPTLTTTASAKRADVAVAAPPATRRLAG